MFIIGNLCIALAKVINLIVGLYTLIVAAQVIISWVQPDPYNPIVRFLSSATRPVFSRVRRFLPAFLYQTGLDWTPLIVIILLMFLETLVGNSLADLGARLK